MLELLNVQNTILKNGCKPYYSVYKDHEINYWKHIASWMMEEKISNCLDIGIAYGTLAVFAKEIHGCNIAGIDFVRILSDELISMYNIAYNVANIETDSFECENKFDCIIMTEIFEHLNFNPIPTLLKVKDMLTDDGCIYFSTPDASSWGKLGIYHSWRDIPDVNDKTEILDQHIYQYNINELNEIFDIVGLKIEKMDISCSCGTYRHFNMKLVKV